MCFRLQTCLCCIPLEAACKIIGMGYMVITFAKMILFGVPVAMGGDYLPPTRIYFYFAMLVGSIALFASALLLVIGASTKTPQLLIPWVVSSVCVGASLLALCVVGLVTIPLRYDKTTVAEEGAVISVYIVHALFLCYFGSVVNSFKWELQYEEDKRALRRLNLSHKYHDCA